MSLVSKLLVVTLGLLAVTAPARATDVKPLDWREMDRWLGQPVNQVESTLADKTLRIELTQDSVGSLRSTLGSGSVFLYISTNRTLAWWTSQYETVQSGRWSVTELFPGTSLPCFQFETSHGLSDCFSGGTANYREWAAGNPFELDAGAVPNVSITGRSTLRDLARQLGQ